MLGDVAILQENNNQDFLRKIVTPAANSVQAYDANKNPVTVAVDNLLALNNLQKTIIQSSQRSWMNI